ncbi:MAG TPA: GDYXXLXY domain-containing protein [Hyphomicrobiaceae bacterium]|jgi:uncharacterized membrane-anchored protein
MIGAPSRILLALASVGLAQTSVLAYMVIDRVRLLASGRQITLPVVPVDPRDLFRGEYARLGYDVGNVSLQLLEGPRPRANRAFYVVLEKMPDGNWHAVKMARELPQEPSSPDRIALKARSSYAWPQEGPRETAVRVRYGIESYFVPEGQAGKLEALAREKKLATLIAVDGKGNAAIKGILIDGVLQYEEPFF